MKIPILVIVEGDEYFGDSMVRSLQDERFDALLVKDGSEALPAIRRANPQVVVLDVSMPHLTGEEIMLQKGRDPRISSIPTIMITKSGDPAEIDRALSLGAKDYLVKGEYSVQALVSKVKQQLEYLDLTPKKKQEVDEIPSEVPPLYGKKVVWIDIEVDAFFSDVISRRLSTEGVKFVRVPHDDLMIRRVGDEQPNVILLDAVTSDEPALAVLRELKSDPDVKRVPTLIFTNFAEDESVARGMALGAAEFLHKATVTVDDILDRIKALS